MKKTAIFFVIAFSALTVSAQADEIQRSVERFKDVAHLAEAHCKDVYGETDRCLDRQFNCFVEVMNLEGTHESALDRATRDASTYNREGNTIAVDFCMFVRRAKIYDVQEQARQAREEMGGW